MANEPQPGVDFPLGIRPGMDVFDAYQTHFVGSVVRVWRGPYHGPGGGARGAEKERVVSDVALIHEEGHVAGHATAQGNRMSGEAMGPVPTMPLGNTGPIRQSAEHDYATGEWKVHPRWPDTQGGCVYFAVRPRRINLGPFTRRLYIPTSAVRSISMERVILSVVGDEIPEEWRRPPV